MILDDSVLEDKSNPIVAIFICICAATGILAFFLIPTDILSDLFARYGFFERTSTGQFERFRDMALSMVRNAKIASLALGIGLLVSCLFAVACPGMEKALRMEKYFAGKWNFHLSECRLPVFFSIGIGLYAIVIFFYVLAGAVYYILADANWILSDDHQFWSTILIGKPIPMPIVPAIMRFFPLSFVEYNMFLPFGNVPYAIFSWQALKFLALVGVMSFTIRNVLFKCFNSAKEKWFFYVIGIFSIGCFMLLPSSWLVFSQIIYPEASLTLLLSLYVMFAFYVWKKGGVVALVLAVLCGSLSMYFKEPVAFALFISVCPPLFFGFGNLSKRQKILCLSMIASTAVFSILFYFCTIAPRGGLGGENYASGRVSGFSIAVWVKALIVEANFPAVALAAVFALFRIARSFYCAWKKEKVEPVAYFFDGLLYASLSYAFAFYQLQLMAGHYFVPFYAFMVPSCAYYLFLALERLDGKVVAKSILLTVALMFFAVVAAAAIPFARHKQILANERRKVEMPTLEKIAPVLENGCLILFNPRLEVFHSNFHKGEFFSWENIVTVKAFEFLLGKKPETIVYDPYGTISETGLSNFTDVTVIRSLEELGEGADEAVLFVSAQAMRFPLPKELEKFTRVRVFFSGGAVFVLPNSACLFFDVFSCPMHPPLWNSKNLDATLHGE